MLWCTAGMADPGNGGPREWRTRTGVFCVGEFNGVLEVFLRVPLLSWQRKFGNNEIIVRYMVSTVLSSDRRSGSDRRSEPNPNPSRSEPIIIHMEKGLDSHRVRQNVAYLVYVQ